MTSFRIAGDANRRNVKFIHSYDIRRLARSGFLSSSKPPSSTGDLQDRDRRRAIR